MYLKKLASESNTGKTVVSRITQRFEDAGESLKKRGERLQEGIKKRAETVKARAEGVKWVNEELWQGIGDSLESAATQVRERVATINAAAENLPKKTGEKLKNFDRKLREGNRQRREAIAQRVVGAGHGLQEKVARVNAAAAAAPGRMFEKVKETDRRLRESNRARREETFRGVTRAGRRVQGKVAEINAAAAAIPGKAIEGLKRQDRELREANRARREATWQRVKERTERPKEALVAIKMRMDNTKFLGKSASYWTEAAVGFSVGAGAKAIVRVVLASSGGWGIALGAGSVAGAIKAGGKEYKAQAESRERFTELREKYGKEGDEKLRKELKAEFNKIRGKNLQKFALATTRGAILGGVGAVVGAATVDYVVDHADDIASAVSEAFDGIKDWAVRTAEGMKLPEVKLPEVHLPQRPEVGQAEARPYPGARAGATETLMPTGTPTPTETPVPTATPTPVPTPTPVEVGLPEVPEVVTTPEELATAVPLEATAEVVELPSRTIELSSDETPWDVVRRTLVNKLQLPNYNPPAEQIRQGTIRVLQDSGIDHATGILPGTELELSGLDQYAQELLVQQEMITQGNMVLLHADSTPWQEVADHLNRELGRQASNAEVQLLIPEVLKDSGINYAHTAVVGQPIDLTAVNEYIASQ
ncbi:hypothetical protein A2630_01100 [Candidatus Woesebacteria bacterium RIFCSPHIGHO2_01_FULL_44_10]|uniref:Uncharacterized protein n=1 Tax=Candidatus Woesebacteria bacterium RIFCSPLOWO2_01_FULL_44_14 TaxID=1802525 RepID=A0A1F8C3F5_9BACT|nr:MAG: hypothetical protein A2630_01100 [Candidatus Woesebacteria bacterium RIFCSPHIGHO2_01_FULL_44_10]OGM70185.1 MAG: hypothetical protein A2975_03875 [Candidatus Woesebacteria bacterium RIFCSPLOWO2_01_FULL_44_14]